MCFPCIMWFVFIRCLQTLILTAPPRSLLTPPASRVALRCASWLSHWLTAGTERPAERNDSLNETTRWTKRLAENETIRWTKGTTWTSSPRGVVRADSVSRRASACQQIDRSSTCVSIRADCRAWIVLDTLLLLKHCTFIHNIWALWYCIFTDCTICSCYFSRSQICSIIV